MTGRENSTCFLRLRKKLVAAVEYVDEKIIANTYSYKDGNIETITHNGFQFAFSYDENGDIIKNIITTNLISGGKLLTVISEDDTTERTLYVNESALLSSKYTASDKGIIKIEYQDGKIY